MNTWSRESGHLVSFPCVDVKRTTTLEPLLTFITSNSVCDLQERFRHAIYQFDKV